METEDKERAFEFLDELVVDKEPEERYPFLLRDFIRSYGVVQRKPELIAWVNDAEPQQIIERLSQLIDEWRESRKS